MQHDVIEDLRELIDEENLSTVPAGAKHTWKLTQHDLDKCLRVKMSAVGKANLKLIAE